MILVKSAAAAIRVVSIIGMKKDAEVGTATANVASVIVSEVLQPPVAPPALTMEIVAHAR